MIAIAATLPLLFASIEVPRFADPAAQLDYARARARELRGAEGDARTRARDAAVAAYRAVRQHHPAARAAVAEAAFRAGELLRAGERAEEALVEFRLAAQEGAGTPYRVRARLEVAHLLRRAGESDAALTAYFAVIGDSEACGHRRDEALLWSGRVHADLDRDEDARRAWNHVAEEGEDPLDRVRAFDELGVLWIRRGDPAAAAGVWNRCRVALAEEALEETERGERLRDALKRMRTVRALRQTARDHIEEASSAQDAAKKIRGTEDRDA